ncbi:FxSxx-COOH cyclophane-containing RiPP peptide [Streptomyces sp. NPDC002643]
MDAPQNSHEGIRLVDLSEVPAGWLDAAAKGDTALGFALRRHCHQEREGRSVTTHAITFESAL